MTQSQQAKMAEAIQEIESKLKQVKDEYFNTENFDDIDWEKVSKLGQEMAFTSIVIYSEGQKEILFKGVEE